MKTLFCVLMLGVLRVSAQTPIITSFSQNGVLVCSNLAPGGQSASVQWASSPSGPWQTNWAALTGIMADSNGTIHVSVPMFYRVVGSSQEVPSGAFTMGNSIGDDDITDAAPTSIYLSTFFMDVNLVSYALWTNVFHFGTNAGYAFDGYALSKNSSAIQPAVDMDWFDCVKWCNARSQQAGLTPVYYTDAGLTQVYTSGQVTNPYANWDANGYRLPTEAEWEKAARGSFTGQRFPWGDTISEAQANYYGDTNDFSYDLGPNGPNAIGLEGGILYFDETSQIGSFSANGYGLYDMAGNVFEWCWDWYGSPYGQPSDSNPTGAPSGSERVLRGGAWDGYASFCRCAYREMLAPNMGENVIGFRCVRGH